MAAAVGVAMVVVGAVAVGVVVRSRGTTPAPAHQQVAVPAYIPPETDPAAWDRLIGASSDKVGIVVANVASGPGPSTNAAWSDVMARTHNSGKRVLGYVDTGYLGLTGKATRTGEQSSDGWSRQIQRDIDAWYEQYPGMVDGIFFDRAANTCGADDADADLYRAIDDRQKSGHPGSVTVLNVGTTMPQCYEDAADVLVTYESTYDGYVANANQAGDGNYQSPGWTPTDPDKFWHIVYGVPSAQVEAVIATARDRGAGHVYVTDRTMPNPYETLPADPYWSTEQSSVSGAPAASLPAVTPATGAKPG